MFMRWFRALAALSAGAWLGGMILIAIAAQTTFEVMRTLDVDTPNTFAGRIMAVEFARFDRVQYACAAIVLLYSLAAVGNEMRQRRDVLRVILVVLACGLLCYSAFVVTPKILAMQDTVAGTTDEAIREAFAEIHETSVLVAKINLFVVLLVAFELALPRRSNPAGSATPQTAPVGTNP